MTIISKFVHINEHPISKAGDGENRKFFFEKTWKFLFQKTTQPISTKLGKKLHGIKGFKFSNEFAVDTIINVLLFYFVIKGVGIIIILFKPGFFLP